ncbi:YiiD C-terminal domain-containing protein [Halarcobacter sp.]|uniref:YiiD C-terminal domain-containing protein n=1 Tax=Halarcobacter sp. TaxID=2321133 RepID=UPI002AAC2E81|nr:YiiD C-terminal domain-containing protein [Halarcobacter sp.]
MLEDLQKKLYSEIPLTKYMQLKFTLVNEKSLISTAPLTPNINDKGTAFAGSLSTLVTISAWSVCYLIVKKLAYENAMIAVIKSDTSYRAPVTDTLNCETIFPKEEEIELLKDKLKKKKSASIKINSNIFQDDTLCVEFKGVYVIKV